MKTLHLLCEAHIDPAWLWQKEEGVAEAISTFRVAANFCEEFDGFVFNHNESVLYEWVEEYEPALFERIKKLVAAGKWKIMGGWYLQPDCLMPCGESFIRQIEVGNRYFWEKFGVRIKTGVNFDSFGHSRGLVQILSRAHYDSYVFMRPNGLIPENNFIWRGYDGSEIIGHNIYGSYGNGKGEAVGKIHDAAVNKQDDNILVCWGIGNHGGGPSREDLKAIAAYKEEHKDEYNVVHSHMDAYFATVKKEGLGVAEFSPGPSMVGCYTSVVRIKQTHRALENELSRAERMLSAAGLSPDPKEMYSITKALLFNEFHDILPGSLVKPSEDAALRHMNYARELLSSYCMKAFFKLNEGQPACKEGELPIMVFNPNPYPITQVIEVEFQLQNQNWNEDEVTMLTVKDANGNVLPSQNEQEDSNIPLDWRKRVAFTATLAPMVINRFNCELTVKKGNRHPVAPYDETDTHIFYKNDRLEVKINKETGLLDCYRVDGVDYLQPGSAAIKVYQDSEDAWLMTNDGFYDQIGTFTMLSKEEANAFNGYPNTGYENLRVVENGEVRMKLQATFKHANSYALVTYSIPKQGTYVDIKVKLLSNDVLRLYKLAFHTTLNNATFEGQSVFGKEKLNDKESEGNFQKWCALKENGKGFAVLNRGTHGGSRLDNTLQLTLLRTAVYSGHPLPNRNICDDNRWHDHIDIGEREFEYRLTTDMQTLSADAEAYNQTPYVLSFFPSGSGEMRDTAVSLSNKQITLSTIRETPKGTIVRLFNNSENEETATLLYHGKSFNLSFTPYEIKTLLDSNGVLTESEMILL